MEPGARFPFLSRDRLRRHPRPRARCVRGCSSSQLPAHAIAVVVAVVVAVGGLGAARDLAAKTFETRDAALQRVFGAAAHVERRSVFLTPEQRDAAQALAAARIESAHISFHEAMQGDSLLGRAYLDTHRVRNEHETLLVVVGPEGRTREVDILAFHEPEDYRPPPRWLATLRDRALSRRLRPGDGVDAISGATLSARAATDAVRRILAVDSILHGGPR